MRGILRALKHASFAWLFTGQTISRLGDSFYALALAWWVVEKTGSAAAMGTVLILGAISCGTVFLSVLSSHVRALD